MASALQADAQKWKRVFQPRDTLYLKNGSIVVGEIDKVQLGVLIFDPDDANDITVQLRKIKSLHAVARDFRIETNDHQVFIGTFGQSVHSGFSNVILGTDTTPLFLNNISTMYPVAKSFVKRINGSLGAGYTYTKSSDLGRLDIDASAKYLNRKTEFNVDYSSITTFEGSTASRDNENAGIRYNYLYHARWFGGGLFNYQRNIELGIQSRLQEGLGFGNKIVTGKLVQLVAFTGFVVNQETSTEGVYSGILTEGMFGMRFNVFRFAMPEVDIETTQNVYLSLRENRYRYDGNVSVRFEMIKDFDLTLSFYTNYDSKPPGQESANIDYGTVIGLMYRF
jgi:hypothetical protein